MYKLTPCHTFTSLSRDENFEPNLNITSQTRGLNLGPSVNALNGVFFSKRGHGYLRTQSHDIMFQVPTLSPPLRLLSRPFIRTQRLGPDSSELNGMARD